MDSPPITLTQKRSQVRVQFRPLKYPIPGDACFNRPINRDVAGGYLTDVHFLSATDCCALQPNRRKNQIGSGCQCMDQTP